MPKKEPINFTFSLTVDDAELICDALDNHRDGKKNEAQISDLQNVLWRAIYAAKKNAQLTDKRRKGNKKDKVAEAVTQETLV